MYKRLLVSWFMSEKELPAEWNILIVQESMKVRVKARGMLVYDFSQCYEQDRNIYRSSVELRPNANCEARGPFHRDALLVAGPSIRVVHVTTIHT